MNQMKAWREQLGITQAEAAELLGFSVSAIRAMENDRRPILLRTLKLMEANFSNNQAQ